MTFQSWSISAGYADGEGTKTAELSYLGLRELGGAKHGELPDPRNSPSERGTLVVVGTFVPRADGGCWWMVLSMDSAATSSNPEMPWLVEGNVNSGD